MIPAPSPAAAPGSGSPQVSVIIPCYNGARFLAATLDSVLAQTWEDYEVLVIDDGSTDDSLAIVRSFVPRFAGRLSWETTSNRGVGAARNRGTELATGRYLLYLDADDLLRPQALARRVRAMQTHGADVVYAGQQLLVEDAAGRFTPGAVVNSALTALHPHPEIAILTRLLAHPSTLLYARRIVERIGGWDEELASVEDTAFLYDAAYFGGKFVHLPEVDTDYRIARDHSSLSRSDPARMWRNWVKLVDRLAERWQQDGSLEVDRLPVLLAAYGRATSALYEWDRALFWAVWTRLGELDPGFSPARTRKMRWISRLFGYPRAEALALFARRLKGRLPLRPGRP